MHKISSLFNKLKNGLLQMFGANIINKIVTMISGMIVARMLDQQNYGVWSSVINLFSYFSIVNGLGIVNGAFQFGAENQGKEKEHAYLKYAIRSSVIIAIVITLTSEIIFWSIGKSSINRYLSFYLPLLLLEGLFNCLVIVLRCENRIKDYAKVLNINTILFTLGTCIGSTIGIPGMIMGRYLAYILTLLCLFYFLKKDINKLYVARTLSMEEKVEMWKFSIISCVCSAMNSLLYLLDVTMITSMIGNPEETAIYKVATIIPNALSFIPSSIMVCILPNLIQHNKDYSWLRKKIRIYYISLAALNISITIFVIIFARLGLRIMVGNKYDAAVEPLRILMFGYAISSTLRIMSANILFGLKKVHINLFVNFIAGLFDVALNYFFIINMGMMGASYATVISEAIASVLAFVAVIYYVYLKRYKEN